MAVTNDQILTWLSGNIGATDAEIFNKMQQFGVTPEQLAAATGGNAGDIKYRYDQQLQTATALQPQAPAQAVTGTAMPTHQQPSSNLFGDIYQGYNTINALAAIPELMQPTSLPVLSATGSLEAAADAAAGKVLNAGGTAWEAQAAADSVLNGSGGLFSSLKSFINPASLVLAGFGAFTGSREAKAAAENEYLRQLYQASKADLANKGINVEELYSPANLENWVTDMTVFNDPTMTPEILAQQMQDKFVMEHANNLLQGQQTQIDVSQYPQRDMGTDADIAKGVQSGSLNVITGTDNQQYVIDKEGYVSPYTPQAAAGGGQPEVATLATPVQWESVQPDTTLTKGDLGGLGGFDYSVYGANEQVDPNAKPREDSVIVWRHTNPDGSVVVGDPMGEIWQEKPPEDTKVVLPPVTPTPTPIPTPTPTFTPTPTQPVVVSPPAAVSELPGPITGIPGTGTGTDTTGTEQPTQPKLGMLGLGATETSELVFPEIYKMSRKPYTLVGNLLSYPLKTGLFS